MSEISRHLPTLLEALPLIEKNAGPAQFILPVAPGIVRNDIMNMIGPDHQNLRVVEDNIYDVMQTADLLLVASGTVTVEAMIMAVPMIVMYRVSPLTYFLGRLLIKVDHIGMVNIIAGKKVVPELIQKDFNPKRIAHTVTEMVKDPLTLQKIREELAAARKRIGNPGASARAARVIIDDLQKNDFSR
jgi:lipid-A-disaccharide synthase